MPSPLLESNQRHPITLPNGEVFKNTVWLKNVINHPNIEVGDFTYYNDFDTVEDYASRIAPYLYEGAPEKLKVGKFCQFAHGTKFITSSADHPKDWFTTYPFAVFNHDVAEYFREEFSKGQDTIIGHDVWIGHNAMILPGVTIGNGTIIGAGAVVAKNIPSYSVVVGNPGKIVKKRFTSEGIALLEMLAWWHRPLEEIREILPLLLSKDEAALKRYVM